MSYWGKDDFEEDEVYERDITSEGRKWVDAARYEGWSRREAEDLGREWDRLEEKDRYK